MSTLTVANARQARLFNHYIKPQILEGRWSHLHPKDHSTAWNVTAQVGDLPGRSFLVTKDNYSLLGKKFLSEHSPFMLAFMRIAEHLGERTAVALLPHIYTAGGAVIVDYPPGVVDVRSTALEWALHHSKYTHSHLKRDLRELRTAMQTYLPSEYILSEEDA